MALTQAKCYQIAQDTGRPTTERQQAFMLYEAFIWLAALKKHKVRFKDIPEHLSDAVTKLMVKSPKVVSEFFEKSR